MSTLGQRAFANTRTGPNDGASDMASPSDATTSDQERSSEASGPSSTRVCGTPGITGAVAAAVAMDASNPSTAARQHVMVERALDLGNRISKSHRAGPSLGRPFPRAAVGDGGPVSS
ncbi:hypothetical protein [Methylobacterium sp.]|uniref:hypothetical protein n=1 Tax=Methylobacterium sp. TaxID=409 RepID=UPI0015C75B8D|nr:hypothetical protein [Methylobacterium sp.]